MIEGHDLETAAEQGLLTPEQVGPLFKFLATRASAPDAALVGVEGEEQLRFLRSFGDVFVSIGVVLRQR